MLIVRRTHLYFGLFLLPWAVLYGVSAFLFNHPTAFSDQPTTTFDASVLMGTPLESPPTPAAVAGQVVEALRSRTDPPADYTLVDTEEARYVREFAFATVKTDAAPVSVLLDVTHGGGTVRQQPIPAPAPPSTPAPFAVGSVPSPGGRGPRDATPRTGLKLTDPLHERVKAAVPVVLERTGFPGGEVTVTSVPDLAFRMRDAAGTTWAVTYNAMAGSVAGRPADLSADSREGLSTRRFLLRLHTAHGYPSAGGAKWWWAVIVDVMAGVMVFWGVSGLCMWWQLKAARIWGAMALVAGVLSATALAIGMYSTLAG